ncbi:MAG: hypothetical protein IJ841_07785 [Prevotella sp.]|nr:hypothetical protein [Prevotella sp.]
MKATHSNGLKGQKAPSPGQRPGYKGVCEYALKGQKHTYRIHAFALSGRSLCNPFTQGAALGWELSGLSGRLCGSKRQRSSIGRLCGSKRQRSSIGRLCGSKRQRSSIDRLCGSKRQRSSIGRLCGSKRQRSSIDRLCGSKRQRSSIDRLCGTCES